VVVRWVVEVRVEVTWVVGEGEGVERVGEEGVAVSSTGWVLWHCMR
jgi:hypothetical protein